MAVAISVTSLDPVLSGKLEPRCAAPAKRIAALGKLAGIGVPVHCSVSPIIPAITDEFMEEIIARAAEVGVRSANWIPLRLPHEVAPLFREWLAVHYPDRASKVMRIVRSIRGGRDNDPDFFTRMTPLIRRAAASFDKWKLKPQRAPRGLPGSAIVPLAMRQPCASPCRQCVRRTTTRNLRPGCRSNLAHRVGRGLLPEAIRP